MKTALGCSTEQVYKKIVYAKERTDHPINSLFVSLEFGVIFRMGDFLVKIQIFTSNQNFCV